MTRPWQGVGVVIGASLLALLNLEPSRASTKPRQAAPRDTPLRQTTHLKNLVFVIHNQIRMENIVVFF